MKSSVVRTLVLADWHRHQAWILGTLVGGALGIGLMQVGGELPTIVGAIVFFTGMIVLACILPVSNVINERKKQTLPFLMSLPISVTEFTTAKVVSTVGIFLLPWLALVFSAFYFIVSRADIPNGVFPAVLIIATLVFIGFGLIAATAIVTESEGATMAATIAANSTYGLSWYMLVRNKAIREGMKNPAIVWSKEVVTVLGIEFGIIVVILAITFYLQSRKRDFV